MMYGSVINRVMEQSKTPEIVVGMGATECLWTDRHAYEVIAVQDEKHITVRRLNTNLKPGTTWLEQEYEYSSNPDNAEVFIEHDVEYVEEHSVYGCDNTEMVGAVCHATTGQTPSVVIY